MRHDERPGIVEMIRELSDRVAELGFGDEALGDDALTEVGHELKKDRPAAVPRRVDVDQRVHSDVDEASGAKQSPSFRLLRNDGVTSRASPRSSIRGSVASAGPSSGRSLAPAPRC